MGNQARFRQITLAVLCLYAVLAAAQEPPPLEPPAELPATPGPPAGEAAPAETAPVEPTPVEPVPTEAPADVVESHPSGKRIVVLPVEFTVYQQSVAGIEAVPDWTESAKYALGEAAMQMLRQDSRFEIVDVPEFDGATKDLLREHVELFKIIGTTATSMLQYGGKAWEGKKTNFDYSLGDGLGFLAEASGAGYAFILAGRQIAQTGGAAFMQFLAAAGGYAVSGGGTFMYAGIVDLRTGDVKWLNSRQGAQVFGMTGTDVRNPIIAFEVVMGLFSGFPESAHVKFPPF
jgi:hypothetical protein